MLNLEKTERIIIIFLTLALILGLGIAAYNKYHKNVKLRVEKFDFQQSVRGNKININEASPDELASLEGIGPAMARRIAEYRDINGRFLYVSDIKKVKGIGEAIFEKIKDDISVE